MKNNDILTFNEKEAFNSKILNQYDIDGQRAFFGYLIKSEKWTVERGEIIFPNITSKERIQKLLKDFDIDIKRYNVQIMKQDLRNISVLGLASFEDKVKKIEKEIKGNEKRGKERQ